jgi:hypothetical protein
MSQRELESKAQIGTTVHRQPAEERDEEEEHPIARLQQQYGNRAVGQMLDRRAEDDAEVAPEIEEAIQRARGGGQALDSGVRAQMEPALGADFSGVRVHTGSEADALNRKLNARAFTTGKDVFFRQGAYSPDSSSGRELLAHELTHVVQQAGGARPKLAVGQPSDRYEQEADRAARAVLQQEQQPTRKDTDEELVQRQVEEEEEEEEEPVQTKAEEPWIQRQAEEDEEKEPLQTNVEGAWAQRQAEAEEQELSQHEWIQTKERAEFIKGEDIEKEIADREQRVTFLYSRLEKWEKRLELVERAAKDLKKDVGLLSKALHAIELILRVAPGRRMMKWHRKTMKSARNAVKELGRGRLFEEIVRRKAAELAYKEKGPEEGEVIFLHGPRGIIEKIEKTLADIEIVWKEIEQLEGYRKGEGQ